MENLTAIALTVGGAIFVAFIAKELVVRIVFAWLNIGKEPKSVVQSCPLDRTDFMTDMHDMKGDVTELKAQHQTGDIASAVDIINGLNDRMKQMVILQTKANDYLLELVTLVKRNGFSRQ